jgi:hypothetical protein
MNSTASSSSLKKTIKASGNRLSLGDRLGLIGLIDEGVKVGSEHTPLAADLFDDLSQLVDATVSGSRIDRLKPETCAQGFKLLELKSETGEHLGRLNMLYLNKPIPCYYLVYVEIAAPFRNKGLGTRILCEFRDFLVKKSVVGMLDNIIPREDPTYDIYLKLKWRPIEEITGQSVQNGAGQYMVFIPPALEGRDLKEPIHRLWYHLKRKRPTIDMRDNELMVGKTIEEFKDLYSALTTYFARELLSGQSNPLMRFMFTRYVTKLLGFKRRIGQLLGYTGGESLAQIALDDAVRELPIQSYAPRELASKPAFVSGKRELWLQLPEPVKNHPARAIESLANYKRPSLTSWLESRGLWSSDILTVGDLMDLGFDPSRLKELQLGGEDYIIERLQPRRLPEVERKKELLEAIAAKLAGRRANNALIATNPPLLIIRDRGNCYVLRRKVQGIHWEEAVEQLQTQPQLKDLNAAARVDRIVLRTARKAAEVIRSALRAREQLLAEQFAFFVSWDLVANQPRMTVDCAGSFLESVWIA